MTELFTGVAGNFTPVDLVSPKPTHPSAAARQTGRHFPDPSAGHFPTLLNGPLVPLFPHASALPPATRSTSSATQARHREHEMKHPINTPVTFPRKLYDLISSESSDIVDWAEHGLAFVVKQPDVFTQEILPKYFRRECARIRRVLAAAGCGCGRKRLC